mgnify:CR=1 FL=1
MVELAQLQEFDVVPTRVGLSRGRSLAAPLGTCVVPTRVGLSRSASVNSSSISASSPRAWG